jgi:ethanolamine ammonia-lyase large subunit
LPPPPDFAQPVAVAQPRAGEPLVGIAARERAGRVAANNRLAAFRYWYEAVRNGYSGVRK